MGANRQTGKFALLLPGANANPDDIPFTDTLPKTKAGKIISRLLRDSQPEEKCQVIRRHWKFFSGLEKLRNDE